MTESAPAETETQATDSGETPLEVYEWGGGIVAGLGFFLTPAVTGIPAMYCAVTIQEEKPLGAIGIGIILLATVLFWGGFLLGEEVMVLLLQGATASVLPILALGVGLFALLLAAFSLVVLRRE